MHNLEAIADELEHAAKGWEADQWRHAVAIDRIPILWLRVAAQDANERDLLVVSRAFVTESFHAAGDDATEQDRALLKEMERAAEGDFFTIVNIALTATYTWRRYETINSPLYAVLRASLN